MVDFKGGLVPIYNLHDVQKAAVNGKIEYRGRKVRNNIEDLGYELEDVKKCLLSLTESHFRKTHYREGEIPDDDDYVIKYYKQLNEDESRIDELYIKFCLVDECLCINLGSFHLQQ